MTKILEIFSDGACSGNPGPAAIGVVIKENNVVIKEVSRSIGLATNNIAEYAAVIEALEQSRALSAKRVIIHLDSELIFNQVRGTYQVKNEELKRLCQKVKELAQVFDGVEFRKVPREENKSADRLAREGVGAIPSSDGRPDVFHIGEESPSSKG